MYSTDVSPHWTPLTLFCVFLAVGDTVSEDEVVCEIETDKVKKHTFVFYLNQGYLYIL